MVLLGVAAFCWALWLSRNEVVFQRSKPLSFLQVMFKGIYWIRSWSILSKEVDKLVLTVECRRLEIAALDFFNRNGWNTLKRIQF
jgi:hypothetical protein